MDKGETIMPTPEGIITTSVGPVDTTPVEEAPAPKKKAASKPKVVEDDLPELS